MPLIFDRCFALTVQLRLWRLYLLLIQALLLGQGLLMGAGLFLQRTGLFIHGMRQRFEFVFFPGDQFAELLAAGLLQLVAQLLDIVMKLP